MAKKKKEKPFKPVDRIEVYIWKKFVGALALDPSIGFYVFAYDKKFAQTKIELSPIRMPLTDTEQPFVFTDLAIETYKRLPAMLADALPDDFGNALVDKYMADKGIPKSKITVLDRLAYMGSRSMGAFEFKPSHGPKTKKPTALEMEKLVHAARQAVSGNIKNDDLTNAALRSIIEVGTSANGARAKAVIAWNRSTDEIRSGQVAIPNGFEHWLLKFDGMGKDRELGTSEDYGRIEYVYYLMAKEAGINISESRLFKENKRAHFMTKRFDREGSNIKHHIQSLCAMNHIDFKKKSTNSYEQLFMTIKELNLDRNSLVEAFRRMVFNIMSKNCDDHSKNFSFLLKDGQDWELAPAYDITFAHNPNGEWTHQHLLSINGKYKDIELEDLKAAADRFGVGELDEIVDSVRAALKDWPKLAKSEGISEEEIKKIKGYHLLFK